MKKYFFACPLRGSVISLVYIMPASSMFQCIMQPTRKVYVNSFWSLNLTSCMHIKLTSLIFFRSRPNTDRPTGVICYAASVRNRLCSLHVLSKHQIVVVETWKSTCIEYANSNNNSTLKVRNWKLAEFFVLRSKSHRKKPQKNINYKRSTEVLATSAAECHFWWLIEVQQFASDKVPFFNAGCA